MQLQEFVANLNKSYFSLTVENGKLNLIGDKSRLTNDEIQAIRSNKQVIDFIKDHRDELVEYISNNGKPSGFKKTKDISSIYRLSGLQEGMLFHGLFNQKAEAYIAQFACDISNVNLVVFEESWNYVLKLHSILRTAFYYDAFNIPVQSVHKEVKLPIEVIDFTSMNEAEKAAAIRHFEKADRLKGFDFKKPPLMRITFMQLGEDRFRMLWTTHHILFDGWSLPIMMEEFLSMYEQILSGQLIKLKEEDFYEDYIRYIERKDKAQSEQYWRGYLKGLQQGTLLPFVNNTSERTKGAGLYKSLSIDIDTAKTEEIQTFAKRNRLTVNTIVQGVWAYLLHQYTGSSNIVYGVIVSGRPDDLPAVERKVGLYINTLPLHSRLDEKVNIVEWLQEMQADQVKSREHQYSPLHKTQRWSGIQGDLFDSLLVFENYPVSKIISAKKWSLQFDNVELSEQTNYPLTVLVNSAEQINVKFSFNDYLLDEAYVAQIKDQFEHVLIQITGGRIKEVSEVELNTPTQKQQLLFGFNNTRVLYPQDKTIIDLFEEQAEKAPELVAVVFELKQLTYRELNEKSNQLARYLHTGGVGAETLVPIFIERGLEMVVGVLAILKAGGAYVPIDPSYPTERIAFMLEDTRASIIITSSACAAGLPTTSRSKAIEIDKVVLDEQPVNNLKASISPNQLAYIIYTSGSTGRPKGVMIQHSNVYSFICWCRTEFASGNFDIAYASTSISFDLSVYELFYPLAAGKKIRIIENGLQISKYLPGDNNVLINTVPVVVGNLIKEEVNLDNITVMNMAGEPISLHIKENLDLARIEVRNLYGPTEDTTYSTLYRLRQEKPVLIGKPIANTQIFIINNLHQLSPVGVVGEICIGGAGVARGYFNRQELTAEKFVKNTFTTEQGSKLYRTGDLGRWLPDGNIEYLGRIDDQVKIRGFRIELGEIESVLQQSGLVRQSVVVAKEDANKNKRLVGYVVSEGLFNTEAANAYLNSKLPDFMVPAVWVQLEGFPLTANGKIDKKALPNPEITGTKNREFVAPRNEIEQKLADTWQEILGIEKVGIYDNFFELGGHSILAMQVISSLRRKLKLEVGIKDLFLYPTIAAFSEGLLVSSNTHEALEPTIKVVNPRPEHIPLSFSQERLHFIDQLEGSVAYHMPAVLRLKGRLDVRALSSSLKKIVERHEILRTIIRDHEGQQFQVVLQHENWKLNIVDSVADGIEKSTTGQIQELIQRPFNLSTDYMLRADLITAGNDNNILVVTMHHIASDGWSVSILVKEVVELYSSYTEQRSFNLEPLSIQYADYSIWQRTFLQGDHLDKKVSYWQAKLAGIAPLNLPTDYPRPVVQSAKGDVGFFTIDKEQLQKLQTLSKQRGATLFMTLLAAFKVLLYKYTGQQDICVGTPTANRTYKELEGLIGFFLNTIALRSKIDGGDAFDVLLEQVKKTTLEAFEHQDIPFEKVVEAVVKERDLSRNALFQVLFTLQNTPEIPRVRLGNVELSSEEFENKSSKFDLSFNVRELPTGLVGGIVFNTDLFAKETIQRMSGHFIELLSVITEKPTIKIAAIPIISAKEEYQILREFNKALDRQVEEKTLVQLFEEQVAATPGNTALVLGNKKLSYKELNSLSNQLAHFLQSHNVQQGTIVPICIDRSFEMMIGILAILKSGGAYVPIDPDYPEERIGFMLRDTNAHVILTSKIHSDKLKAIRKSSEIIVLDSQWDKVASQPTGNLSAGITVKDLAYVLYTSGSTGTPKGVQIEHNSIAQHLVWFTAEYKIAQEDSSLLISSFSFDGAMTAIWPVLVKGGSLHLPMSNELDPKEVLNYIYQNSISYIKTLPGIFKELINADNFTAHDVCKSLRLIILGGEKINIADVEMYLSYYPRVTFSNHYGPTECTVSSAFYIINHNNLKKYNKQSVVGKAVANTDIYIVGEEGLLNPIGVPGEICIGGLCVARGYLNNEDLTKNKFVSNPFSSDLGGRMYKTGDVGRWLADGNIEFIGRKDEQVKIRGYRVEPGEIENVLLQSSSVREAVVIAKEDNSGTNMLVACIVPQQVFNKDHILAFLKDRLPGFMIPSIIIEVSAFPTTPNGKIDKKALVQLSVSSQAKTEYKAPRNSTEGAIASIWQNLLKLEQVSVDDNFFEVGGHSLLAMRVVSSIRKQLQVELSIKSLFLHPTVEGLAGFIQKQEKGILLPSIEVAPRPAKIPLSFSQERLWFIDQLEGSVQYHIPAVLRLKGNLNIEALRNALQAVVRRHEVLRTVIRQEKGFGYQYILPDEQPELEFINEKRYKEDQEELKTLIFQKMKKPFDLSNDLMARATLIQLGDEEYVLVITMHHIASDGWSTSIFVKEVIDLYERGVKGERSHLAPLKLQYADYSIWQRNYLHDEVLNKKISYWKEKLADLSPLNMPTDSPRPAIHSSRGSVVNFTIEKELSDKLITVSKKQEVTLFMTLLTAFKVLLHKYTGQEDICIGTPVAGRMQEEVEGLIGFFLNTLAIRTHLNAEIPFTSLLQVVKETTLEAFEQQDVPFEKVVEAVASERDMSRRPVFQVMFVLQNTPEIPNINLSDIQVYNEVLPHTTSMFDFTLSLKETREGLMGGIEYCTDLYNEKSIAQLISCFKELLLSIVAEPKTQIGQLRILNHEQELRLLEDLNNKHSNYPKHKTIIDLFEEQVAKTPNATAVIYGDEEISYLQLNERANCLGDYLRNKGVKEEVCVPICIERSLKLIVGILGILKAGGAYVPIDADYPAERIKFMLEDVSATLIITSCESSNKLQGQRGVELFNIDKDLTEISSQSKENVEAQLQPSSLAYVIYTSGSTGRPKGVMVEHGNVVSLVKEVDYVLFTEKDVLLSTGSPSFDATTFEYWGMLLNGGQLVLTTENTLLDSTLLKSEITKRKVTKMWFSSSWFNQLVETDITVFSPLETILVGGERLSEKHIEKVRQRFPLIKVINGYGPTENTTFSLTYGVEAKELHNSIPIGRPLSNRTAYIVNGNGQLVPIGVPGEILLGGAGLSRGYLNRAGLTAEKFVKNPFTKQKGSRLYKTGDLGRFLPDGNVEYLGRIDNQVKIRGFRIELQEIENVLQQNPAVSQSLIVAKTDMEGNKSLVAYVVPLEKYDELGLISYLKEKLPAYMIPQLWVELEKMPLTLNGKVDLRALPDPKESFTKRQEIVIAGSETEKKLVEIWEELLGVEPIGVTDNFFQLGGHSLMVMQLKSIIHEKLKVELEIKDLFQYPTIKEISRFLDVRSGNTGQGNPSEEFELLVI